MSTTTMVRRLLGPVRWAQLLQALIGLVWLSSARELAGQGAEASIEVRRVVFASPRTGRALPPGGLGTLTVSIANPGTVRVTGAVAEFTVGDGMRIVEHSSIGPRHLRKLRVDVGDMPPGASRDIRLTVTADRRAAATGDREIWMLLSAPELATQVPIDLGLTASGVDAARIVAQQRRESLRPPVPTTLPPASSGPAVAAGAAAPSGAPSIAEELLNDLPVASRPRVNALAVIIGNRTYRRAPSVSYAANDAAAMRHYAERVLGVLPGNIIQLEDASQAELKVVFGERGNPSGRLKDLVRAGETEVFVFYSGHGAPDPNTRSAYLMPSDADPQRLALTGYPLDVLYENLASLRAAHVTVVLDACFSGASGDGTMLITSASPIGIVVRDPAARFAAGSATIIAAAEGQQLASWNTERGHGLLTYYYLNGLRGAADRNADGRITVGEMRGWLTDGFDGVPYAARRLFGREQTPVVVGDSTRVIK